MTAEAGRPPTQARIQLGVFLSQMHWIHGPGWAELSRRTGLSVSTLQRTARTSGPVPSEKNVIKFVEGIGDDPRAVTDAKRWWRKARIAERGRLRTLNAPAPAGVRNEADLLTALAAVYERDGAPPLRTLQGRAGTVADSKVPVLPVTNASRIVNRERLPTNQRQYEAFLTGCGIPEHALGPWRQAWHRAQLAQPSPRP
ncbi:hypothetical protein [Streptomyces sp. KS_5]|uniref:hypothetical protein n=1 Tax=Streptomyces sp. KS_5 TaxID=1881018 RepID=UPI0008992329|nr:hypothetical protein [Streptomyces sp. KS_5]SEE34331.1 hypothetical protein SAMN05428938_7925 [Streptomyces sp. KS_5]